MVLQASQPKLVILENVLGLLKVLKDIVSHLRTVGPYHILILTVCPSRLGVDVRRPRFYILMLRRDVVRGRSEKTLQTMVDRELEHAESAFERLPRRDFEHLLFPETHPCVRKWQQDLTHIM